MGGLLNLLVTMSPTLKLWAVKIKLLQAIKHDNHDIIKIKHQNMIIKYSRI